MDESNFVLTAIPFDADVLDCGIMRHIAREVKLLMLDGLSDLDSYGSGVKYDASVFVKFEKREVK